VTDEGVVAPIRHRPSLQGVRGLRARSVDPSGTIGRLTVSGLPAEDRPDFAVVRDHHVGLAAARGDPRDGDVRLLRVDRSGPAPADVGRCRAGGADLDVVDAVHAVGAVPRAGLEADRLRRRRRWRCSGEDADQAEHDRRNTTEDVLLLHSSPLGIEGMMRNLSILFFEVVRYVD